MRKKGNEEEKRNALEIIRLRKEIDKENARGSNRSKENMHQLGNFESELEYVKNMLRKAEGEQEEKLRYLSETVEDKQQELLLLKK